MPDTSNAGAEGTERAIVPADTASPSSSLQFASGNVAPPTSMAENASVTASLRLVLSINLFLFMGFYSLSFILTTCG